MKLKNILIAGAIAASALVTVTASAAVFGELGGPGTGNNDFIAASPTLLGLFSNSPGNAGQGPRIEGYFGGNMWLNVDAVAQIDFFGAEAGYKNDFYLNGVLQFTTDGKANDTSFGVVYTKYANVNAGLLDFSFVLNGAGGGAGIGTVANGSNSSLLTTPNFFVSLGDKSNPGLGLPDTYNDETTLNSNSYVWLFLDDGGAGPDDNHDDMMIRLSFSKGVVAPEPATLSLLGLGLVGLGALRRRKTA